MAWVLKTIRDLKLDPPPHVAICPLGTGNDLSLSMGWGGEFKKCVLVKHIAASHADVYLTTESGLRGTKTSTKRSPE